MKKITKKAFKEAADFVALIDWKTDYKNGFSYVQLQADNVIEAMKETSKLFTDNVYLIKVQQKTEIMTDINGFPAIRYNSVLCTRSKGRYATIGETEFDCPLAYYPELNYFDHIWH